MSGAKNCQKCGAQTASMICEYCGAMAVLSQEAKDEKAGLEEFCRLLQTKDAPAQAKLLETGYLPSIPPVLIEAGVRCVPLIRAGHADALADSALRRLETVVLKLKLLEPSSEIRRAIAEFEPVIRDFKARESSDTFWGLTVLGGLALAILLVAVYLAMRACS